MSKWRTGRKVPINVYDGDRPVCMAQTAIDARTIVLAMNWYNALTVGEVTPISELERENAALRKALEEAPHDRLRCSSLIEPVPGATTAVYRCNCWKAQIPQPTQ